MQTGTQAAPADYWTMSISDDEVPITIDEDQDDDERVYHSDSDELLTVGVPGDELVEVEDEAQLIEDCLEAFLSKDFIMEPAVFAFLKRYFQSGGSPEQVVQLLSDNYSAVAQTVNLLAEWLILTGIPAMDVQRMVESHYSDLIVKHFEPKKADSIFAEEGETPSWLVGMIQQSTWRRLFYQLAEMHPDCVMLNFTLKLISDAGYQEEIANVTTACQQIDIFSRSVLQTTIKSILQGGEVAMDSLLPEFTKMVCHGEHTYLYTQLLLSNLAGQTGWPVALRRLMEELERHSNRDVSLLGMLMTPSARHPRGCTAMAAMLNKRALNPADISLLFKLFSAKDTPPVQLIRHPAFLQLLVDALFNPSVQLNPEHKPKYTYLLAYSCSVVETWRSGERRSINRDELRRTQQAVEKLHEFVQNQRSSVAGEVLNHLGFLYQSIGLSPVCSMGILHWIRSTVGSGELLQVQTGHTPVHLALLDELANCHPLQHPEILSLLIQLFETSFQTLDEISNLDIKKTILDRMVHLLSRGYILPVVQYISSCTANQDIDRSLIRHFVTEVLEMVAPPYSPEFVALMTPIVENESVTGTLVSSGTDEEMDPVSGFLEDCRQMELKLSANRKGGDSSSSASNRKGGDAPGSVNKKGDSIGFSSRKRDAKSSTNRKWDRSLESPNRRWDESPSRRWDESPSRRWDESPSRRWDASNRGVSVTTTDGGLSRTESKSFRKKHPKLPH